MKNASPEITSGDAFSSARFPLQQRLLKQSLQNLDEDDGDNEREIEHADGRNHPSQWRDDGIGHFRQDARDGPLASRVEPGEERPADERIGQKLQELQQNEEDGVRHIVVVLVVPTWVSGGRLLPVFRV